MKSSYFQTCQTQKYSNTSKLSLYSHRLPTERNSKPKSTKEIWNSTVRNNFKSNGFKFDSSSSDDFIQTSPYKNKYINNSRKLTQQKTKKDNFSISDSSSDISSDSYDAKPIFRGKLSVKTSSKQKSALFSKHIFDSTDSDSSDPLCTSKELIKSISIARERNTLYRTNISNSRISSNLQSNRKSPIKSSRSALIDETITNLRKPSNSAFRSTKITSKLQLSSSSSAFTSTSSDDDDNESVSSISSSSSYDLSSEFDLPMLKRKIDNEIKSSRTLTITNSTLQPNDSLKSLNRSFGENNKSTKSPTQSSQKKPSVVFKISFSSESSSASMSDDDTDNSSESSSDEILEKYKNRLKERQQEMENQNKVEQNINKSTTEISLHSNSESNVDEENDYDTFDEEKYFNDFEVDNDSIEVSVDEITDDPLVDRLVEKLKTFTWNSKHNSSQSNDEKCTGMNNEDDENINNHSSVEEEKRVEQVEEEDQNQNQKISQ